MSEQKKIFLTFGGPTSNFHNRVRILCNEAQSLNFFSRIIGVTERFLKNDQDFWKKHGAFMTENVRGYGYWLWKPFIIKKFLEELTDNDILVYCDAGCSFNPRGMKRMDEYIDLVNNNDLGILSFQLNHPEIKYTKRKVLDHFSADINTMKDNQFIATVIILRKNEHTTKIINEWYDTASNYQLINDDLMKNEYNVFKDHRHDQSIYSMLIKKYGAVKINDETFFHPNWETGKDYPIWATRIKL